MAVPERVFVIVVESEGTRDPEVMPLLSRTDRRGLRLTPAFSSMLLATTFLARAQQIGHYVRLDYIFPVDGRRLSEEFPCHEFRLDPSPEAFFGAQRGV
jgi:hypothetical protein